MKNWLIALYRKALTAILFVVIDGVAKLLSSAPEGQKASGDGHRKPAVLLCILGLFSAGAVAATYTLPNGTLPSGCTKASNTSVTCSNNLTLAWADAMVVSNANLTLTVGKTLTFDGGNNINTSSSVSGFAIQAKDIAGSNAIHLKGNLTASNSIALSSNTNRITGDVNAGNDLLIGGTVTGALVAGDSVKSQWATTVTGDVTAGGKIDSGGGGTYGGHLTAGDDITSESTDTISGNVTSNGGAVTLKSAGTRVGGNVSAKNAIQLESGSKVAGSVTSSNDAVLLESSGTTVGNGITAKKAVTIGSGCSVTGDVVTDDGVTLQSASSQVVGNIMAKKKVTLQSSTSVTGNVTTINSDVELKDSNGRVNGCVTVDSNQTLKLGWNTSVAGVCCLSGSTCSATGCVVNNSGNAAPGACAATVSCVVDSFSSGTLNPALWNTAAVSGSFTPSVADAGGSMRLRLTQAVGNQSTMAQLKKWYPGAGNKIVVEFDYYVYGGNGADGVTVVFSDADQSPSPGGFGGSLGYAQRSGISGFGGGWLGVGLDEFGNFSGTGEGRKGYPSGYTAPAGANVVAGLYRNNISVRGSGSGTTGYPLLANTGTLATPLWKNTNSATTRQRFRITIDHTDNVHAYVSVERDLTGSGSSYATLVAPFDAKSSSVQAAVPANWLVSFAGSTGGSYNIHELGNLSICATFTSDPSGGTPAANFECMDGYLAQTNYSNRQLNASSRNPIYTKLVRTGFDLRVVPLAADGSLKSDYIPAGGTSKNVTVELFDDTASPRPACSAFSGPVATQTATLISGVMKTSNFTVNKAYTKLMCRVTDNENPATPIYGCSSDAFAVRPGAVTLATTPAMATAPSATAMPVIKAGSPFTLRATTTTSSTDAYSGTLTQDTSKLTAQATGQDTTQANGGAVGTLTPSSLAANAAAVNAAYSEVGYLYLAVGAYRDSTYTAVDGSTDCVGGNTSVALSSGKYGCVIGNTAAVSFGRFIPDHFSISPAPVTAACTAHPVAIPGGYTPVDFSYFGQDGFETAFTITAKNTTNGTTTNYAGLFGKLDLASYASYGFATATALPAGSTLLASATLPSGSWAAGVANHVKVKHQVGRPTALTGETDVLVTSLPVDTDGVTATAAMPVSSSVTKLRFGRLRLQNNSGSERSELGIPVQAQYWNGTFFSKNADDSCTALTGTLTRSYSADVRNNLISPAPTASFKKVASPYDLTNVLVGGAANLVFDPPNASGWLDISLGVDSWLQYNWGNCNGQAGADSTHLINNPCARATFGIYNAKSPIIYRRENY